MYGARRFSTGEIWAASTTLSATVHTDAHMWGMNARRGAAIGVLAMHMHEADLTAQDHRVRVSRLPSRGLAGRVNIGAVTVCP